MFLQTIRCTCEFIEPVVVLSSGGPLVHYLTAYSKAIYIKELGVLRRKHLSLKGIAHVVWSILCSAIFIWHLVKCDQIEGISRWP